MSNALYSNHVIDAFIRSAVTNVAVTPAAKPFDVIVGCNTFEGVAAKYRCAIRLFTFALSW